jgi:hypothetical protein
VAAYIETGWIKSDWGIMFLCLNVLAVPSFWTLQIQIYSYRIFCVPTKSILCSVVIADANAKVHL